MNEPIHRNPLSAWDHLVAHGGIEIEGRDEGIDLRIHQALNPTATSLDEALVASTMSAFARAFFEAIHPTFSMFQDILDFFKQAEATHGKNQWILQLDDIDISLEHFRQSVAHWKSIAKTDIEVSAIDQRGAWDLCRILGTRAYVRDAARFKTAETAPELSVDVRTWVDAYDRQIYMPMPFSLTPPQCPAELQPTAQIVQTAVQKLLDFCPRGNPGLKSFACPAFRPVDTGRG